MVVKKSVYKFLKNKAPKISVLMPAWNAEKFIREAIDSILAQTFKDFEFIIINDGSTDDTAKIIRSYKDPRIVFVDNKKNQGLIAVLNQGMGMARGGYIARMDADDISMPERFRKQIEYLDANPDVVVLGTSYREFGCSKNHLYKMEGKLGLYDIIKVCKIKHPTTMLRKSVFDKYNLRYYPDYEACEDYELWLRVMRYGAIANLPDMLLKYRWHDDNISVRQKQLQFNNTRRVQESALTRLCGTDKKVRNQFRFYFGNSIGDDYDKGVSAIIWLLGFIPFFRIKSIRASKKIYLFGIIPLAKIKKGKILLFHLIPIAKIGEMK